MKLRVEQFELTTIVALAGLAITLIVLKDTLPTTWLVFGESCIILSIAILTFHIFLGKRIRSWRMTLARRKKLNKIAKESYPELKNLISDFERFVGTGPSECLLSKIYEEQHITKRIFAALQSLPNEQILTNFYLNLKNEMPRLDESFEHFSMLSESLHTLINALANLACNLVSILQWLGPWSRGYLKVVFRGENVVIPNEFDAWLQGQYEIDEKTKNNYSQFREKFNEFCNAYIRFAEKVNGRADTVIIRPSVLPIPDKIE